jgi:FkbM family methyltransferase
MALFRSFRDLLAWRSKVEYIAWRLLRSGRELTLKFKDETRLILRPLPHHDYGVAYEVFVMASYVNPTPMDPSKMRCIVDLGANVGYSCLFWSRKYPNAEIVAFEPHPDHIELLNRNMELNLISNRVTVHAAAAGPRAGTAFLADAGSSSMLVQLNRPRTITVPVVDFFDVVGDRRIDLLKMDIEGGEYALIEDSRFQQLNVGALVLEWHATPEHRDGLQWCTDRLARLGFTIESTIVGSNSGVLWGTREERSVSQLT